MTTGIIFDVKKFALHDGPGIRTTVFFKGCPLSCWLCHNPESQSRMLEHIYRKERCEACGDCVAACVSGVLCLSNGSPADGAARGHTSTATPKGLSIERARCERCGACAEACLTGALELVGREATVDQVMAQVLKDVVLYDESKGGVTFSGGEPLAQPDFLLALLEACKKEELHTVVDTSGHASREVMERVISRTDLFLFDLKIMLDALHRDFTGVSNRTLLDNLRLLAMKGSEVRIRVPVFPGVNDDSDNIMRMGRFLSDLPRRYPVDLLPYHKVGFEKYARLDRKRRLPALKPPGAKRLKEIADTLSGYGLQVNLGDESHGHDRTGRTPQAGEP